MGQITKEQIVRFNPEDNAILRVVGEVQEGNINALDAYLYLTKVMKACEVALERVERLDDLIALAQQYPKGEPVAGLYLSVQNTATTYKYSNAVSVLENQLKKRKEQEKAALKAAEGGQLFIDEATGEVIPAAIATPGKQKLFISLSKR